jgi:hypothetical protein
MVKRKMTDEIENNPIFFLKKTGPPSGSWKMSGSAFDRP